MKNQIVINGIKCLKKGVKDETGKYCPAWYSHCASYGNPQRGPIREAIIIYARSISDSLPSALGPVKNETDTQTDYFEKDRVTFYAGSPEFNALLPLAKKL